MTESPAAPGWDERDLLVQLHRRYGQVTMNARRYAVAEHVPNTTGAPTHVADFVALDVWRTKLVFHGHEVKCSRADWRAELKQPWKSEAIKRYMHHWWLVVPDLAIVKEGELPDDWGLMVVTGRGLRAVKAAPRLAPTDPPQAFTAAFARAVQKTASQDLFVAAAQKQFGATMNELVNRNRHLEALVNERDKEIRQLAMWRVAPSRVDGDAVLEKEMTRAS